jgi:hypothetical protein
MRRMEGGFDKAEPQGAEEVLAEGVMSMRIEYFDGTGWRGEWNEGRHPSALRVSIVLQDLDRPYEQTARKCAFPIRVS